MLEHGMVRRGGADSKLDESCVSGGSLAPDLHSLLKSGKVPVGRREAWSNYEGWQRVDGILKGCLKHDPLTRWTMAQAAREISD